MKKVLVIFIIIISLLVFTGCNKKTNSSESNNKKGDNIESKLKNVSFNLDGNPTTGYEWTCRVDDETIATSSIEYIENKKKDSSDESVGVGGKYKVTLFGIGEGSTILNCKYARSWEETEEDIEIKYNVVVDKNLNVSYTEMKAN